MKHSLNNTRPKATASQKARFFAALAMAETTMTEWAATTGVTQGYVSNVLSGRLVSKRLSKKIDAFIAKHLRDVAART